LGPKTGDRRPETGDRQPETALSSLIVSHIRDHGPLTVAEYMELALYHPEHGYYSGAVQRSGRDGDFFTNVDVGPLFGELLATQLDEMWRVLGGADAVDLVEAGAGNGRLARDVLDAAARHHPEFYAAVRLTLVERSAAAREAQRTTLGPHLERLAPVRADLPASINGILYANELLDAFPVHVVTMTGDGLREIVVCEQDGALVEAEAPVSDPALLEHLPRIDPGARLEVGLSAAAWVHEAAAALQRGFLLLFDYAHEVNELSSRAHPDGTLMAYRGHVAEPGGWLAAPGESDLTAHLDLTSVRRVAEGAGLQTLGIVDQTYFLLSLGLADRVETGHDLHAIRRRLAARTLVMPGALGSTMKAMVFAKGAGTPVLRGTTSGRLT
jgi:SAM-dependent MidA family methyltransferase